MAPSMTAKHPESIAACSGPRVAILALAAALAGGCRSFPLSLVVPDATIETLERSDYTEDPLPRALDARLRDGFGVGLARHAAPAPGIRRLDAHGAGGPYRPPELTAAAHPAITDLRTGDLLLAKNKKPQSLGQTLALAEFTYYDHLGVLVRDGEELFVCESWPRLRLLAFADSFAERFQGGVQRVPLGDFLERYETVELVRLSPERFGPDFGPRLGAAARASLDAGIRYDPHHDPGDPALSCSEYVTWLIEDVLGHELALRMVETTPNPSMRTLLDSLGFRPHAYVVPDSFRELAGSRTVALFSHDRSGPAHLGRRAAFRTLFEHFRRNTEVGSYLTVDPLRLVRYRRNVEAFLECAAAFAEAHPALDEAGVRRELGGMVELFFRPR